MKNIYVDSLHNDINYIGYYVDKDKILNNYSDYEAYIKGCEKVIRNDQRYKDYISKIKTSGVTKCAIFGNLIEGDKIKMETHHGPILTLFDICDIVLRHLFEEDEEDITTFHIADLILTEHELNNIQIVMLSKGVHKAKHNMLSRKDIFLHIKSSIGKIDNFIDKYWKGVQPEHYQALERYIKLCEKYPETVDNGLFDTAERLSSFKKNKR